MTEPIDSKPEPGHPRDAAWLFLPASPGRMVLAVLALVVFVDLVLASVVPESGVGSAEVPRSRMELRSVLLRHESDSWLMLGDSVLAGDVLESKVPGSERLRVIDHIEELRDPHGPAVEQVGMNGLLLGDMLGVVERLDEIDPDGTRGLVIEINPRVFSKQYAGQERCAYDWLCAPSNQGWPKGTAWARATRDGLDQLASWVPVYRHRRIFHTEVDMARLSRGEASAPAEDDLLARARLLPHYSNWELGSESAQLESLTALLERTAANQREVLFFMTPVNEAFFGGDVSEASLGKLSAFVDGFIADAGDSHARYLDLNHPRFDALDFLDHCHLLTRGNRLLGLNLAVSMGLRLQMRPQENDLVYPRTGGRTLLGRTDPGFADGASWVGMTRHPEGIARSPGGDLIIADTGNHALRRIRARGSTLSTWVGTPAKAKSVDGPLDDAGIKAPKHPTFVGETLYFATDGGTRLRRVVGQQVETVTLEALSNGAQITELLAEGDDLLLRLGTRELWSFDPKTSKETLMLRASGEPGIRAVTTDGSGRLFFADGEGRVVELTSRRKPRTYRPTAHRVAGAQEGDARAEPEMATSGPGWKVVFANDGRRLNPRYKKKRKGGRPFFPFDFDAYRVDEIVALHWIDRYEGLLVVSDESARTKHPHGLTETRHLDFFDLEEEEVYPWIRPRAFGGAHRMWNQRTESFVSTTHAGTLAVDQRRAELYYLERDRSRLVRLEDGILGAAKVGHATTTANMSGSQEFYGGRTGREATKRFDPVAKFEQVHDSESGPYVVVMMGTSLTAMADRIGMYSLARVLEAGLQDRFAYLDGKQIELFQRVRPGGSLMQLIDKLEEALPVVRPDVIIVGGYTTVNPKRRKRVSREELEEAMARLAALGRQYDAPVYMLDNMPLLSWHRDGLRPRVKRMERQYEVAREAGIEVIELGDLYLHDHLENAPWGSPPFKSGHASPWSIDAAAERIGDWLYPKMAERFASRPPNWTRPDSDRQRAPNAEPGLGSALETLADSQRAKLPELKLDDLGVESEGERLELLIQVRKGFTGAAKLRAYAIAGLVKAVDENQLRASRIELRVRVVRFTNYDEYGAGVLEGAEILLDESLDVAGVRAFIADLPG